MTDYGLAGVDLSPEVCRECGKPFGVGEQRLWDRRDSFEGDYRAAFLAGPYHRQCFIDTEAGGPAQTDDDGRPAWEPDR